MSTFQLLADRLEQMYEPPSYQWACNLPECDGLPHQGHNYNHARTKQRMPEGNWFIWLLMLGRGWGKTRTGAENFLDLIITNPVNVNNKPTEWLIANKDYNQVMTVTLSGEAGFFWACKNRGIDYTHNQSKKTITFTTGQIVHVSHAENEDLALGKTLSGAWLDEPGTYKRIALAYKRSLVPAMRAKLPHGRPRIIMTTTPRVENIDARDLLKSIVTRAEKGDPSRHVTRGETFENSHNLDPEILEEWLQEYPEGTRLYKQEFLGEMCEAIEGALWTEELIDTTRVKKIPVDARITKRVVTIDPATTSGPNSDMTGIVLAAKAIVEIATTEGTPEKQTHVYIEKDLTMKCPAPEWATVAVETAHSSDADILYEMDQGGDAWKEILGAAAKKLGVACPRIRSVRAATEGSKATRANPVVAGFYNGVVHIVGRLPELEDQMCTWVPDKTAKSPDRIDAAVYAVRDLTGAPQRTTVPILDAW